MVLRQEIARLFGNCDSKSFNEAFLSKHSDSIPHRLAGRRSLPYKVIVSWVQEFCRLRVEFGLCEYIC